MMRLTLKLFLVLTTILGLAPVAFAQEAKPQPSIPSKRKFNHTEKIVTESKEYESGNVTLVTLEPMTVPYYEAGFTLEMFALFAYDKRKPGVPGVISLGFHSRAPKCLFSREPKVTFLLDSEAVVITSDVEAAKRGEGVATRFWEPEGEICSDGLDMHLPVSSFLKVINAKSVNVHTGSADFGLSEDNLEALRDLASRMKP